MKPFRAPRTISESIYHYLRQAVIEGHLKPHQRLQDKEIAAKFNVSPTPVREAFLRLAAEKYLVINARREVLVTGKTAAEARDIVQVIRILDLAASQDYAQAISDKELHALQDLTRKLGETLEDGNAASYYQLNLKLHERIWQSCSNKALAETLTGLLERIAVYRMHAEGEAGPADLRRAFRGHAELLRAIESRDTGLMEATIATHWLEEFEVAGAGAREEAGKEKPAETTAAP